MYTEATTKDGNLGVIVVADTIQAVLDECLSWLKDNRLRACDVDSTKLLDVSANKVVGEISFSDNQVVCVPST